MRRLAIGMSSCLAVSVFVATSGVCLADGVDPALSPGEESAHDGPTGGKQDYAQLGIDPAAVECFEGETFQHAHPNGVARELIDVEFCSDGIHISIALSDTACDNRAAMVAWTLFDSVGQLGEGTFTNGAGCNSTRSVTLPIRSSDTRIHTVLKACSTTCSSSAPFDDII